MRTFPGLGLMLVGSGLYWLLSSQLISSFTVLSPQLFQSIPAGNILITITGVISVSSGLWIIETDLNEFKRLVSANIGWVFTIPLVFAASDIYSTLISLYLNPEIIEVNPFVAAAIQYGTVAIVPFLISYLALAQGLTLMMLKTGQWLFIESRARFLPFAFVCGASAFGPFSNLIGLSIGYGTGLVYLLGAVASAGLCMIAFSTSAKFDRVKDRIINAKLVEKLGEAVDCQEDDGVAHF